MFKVKTQPLGKRQLKTHKRMMAQAVVIMNQDGWPRTEPEDKHEARRRMGEVSVRRGGNSFSLMILEQWMTAATEQIHLAAPDGGQQNKSKTPPQQFAVIMQQ